MESQARNRRGPKSKLSPHIINLVIMLYTEHNKSLRQIVEELKAAGITLSHEAARQILKSNSIEIRQPGKLSAAEKYQIIKGYVLDKKSTYTVAKEAGIAQPVAYRMLQRRGFIR